MNWMVLLLCLVLVVVQGFERRGGLVAAVTLRTGERRPDPSDGAGMARWLVSQNDWGVLRFFSFLVVSFFRLLVWLWCSPIWCLTWPILCEGLTK